jgi:hypothetical protein
MRLIHKKKQFAMMRVPTDDNFFVMRGIAMRTLTPWPDRRQHSRFNLIYSVCCSLAFNTGNYSHQALESEKKTTTKIKI